MASVVAPFALLAAVVNALAAALGAWRWSRGGQPDAWFWRLVRAGQAAAVLLAAAAGVAAEQLRLASAQHELDVRGLPDAQAMRALSEPDQRAMVVAILRREMVVMTCACAVVTFLVLRAAGTA